MEESWFSVEVKVHWHTEKSRGEYYVKTDIYASASSPGAMEAALEDGQYVYALLRVMPEDLQKAAVERIEVLDVSLA